MPNVIPAFVRKFVPALALPVLLAACDDSTAPVADARVEIRLTDAPSDMLDSARVWISAVYLQGGEDDDAESDDETGRVYLFEATETSEPKSFDLLELRDGVVAELAAAEVEPRPYAQLRLVVDSSRIRLADGYTFQDGSTSSSLRIPSGSSSGIKVQLSSEVDPESGTTQTIVVDFDVDDAFRFPGLGQDGVVRQVMFSPVLRELSRSREDGTDD